MQYCPYYYNPYAMNCYNQMGQDMPFEGSMFDFNLENEEAEYYDEMMRQADPMAVNRIMRLINTRLSYL